MEPQEILVRCLLAQYARHTRELLVFLVFFIIAMLAVPVAWVFTHIYHNMVIGGTIGAVAILLGLTMALHSGNTLQEIRKIASALNANMKSIAGPSYSTFNYEQGQATEPVRFWFTTAMKTLAVLLVVWCFFPWPQL